MRWFLLLLWLLLAAMPALADGSDWIVAKPEPVKASAPIESDWTLDTDGSYVRTSRRSAPQTTPSTTPQTRTQSVPQVTAWSVPSVPFTVRTTVPVAVVPSTSLPVFYQTVPTRIVAARAARRGGISFGVSAGACVGGG